MQSLLSTSIPKHQLPLSVMPLELVVFCLQGGQPITFVSQTLTDTQKRYSNIEHELLALVIVIKHLHHYVFGRQFMVNTDHAPLVA